MMPKISIIVPVYNVEPYLRRCIDSILMQTFKNFECILINDGSIDNCSSICDEYTAKDERIRVVHKNKNEGLPRARKTGLDISTGEFVMHIDSDDWIENNALEILLNQQHITGADVVIGGYKEIYKYREIKNIPPKIEKYKHPSCLTLNRTIKE